MKKKNENKYQPHIKKRLEEIFPGCVVTKQDPNDIQGIPDLAVFYKNHWAWLETKKSEKAGHRPNQDYYVNYAKENSFGAFIQPENEEEVLNELVRSFEA